MAFEHQEDAERQARKWARMAWKRFHLKAPVDIGLLVSSLGIDVYYKDLGRKVSGIYVRSKSGTYFIINQNDSPNRQRFTLAHEIFHHLQSRGREAAVVSFDLRQECQSKTERACDVFAAELLMPDWWTVGTAYSCKHMSYSDTVRVMADLAKVSKAVVVRRLRDLGLRI
jgi:Zn-dependent peptidase ImmA (M78 family)